MKRFDRRKFTQGLLSSIGAAVVSSLAPRAFAKDEQIMRIIVPYAPGGGGDLLGRLFADKLAQIMGRTIIVENKPGANATIGSNFVAKSRPDGNTILLNVPMLIQTYFTMPSLPYDPFTDFIPVVDLVKTAVWFAIDPKKTSANSVAELLEWGKANPGSLTYGITGQGTTSHLFGGFVENVLGVKAVGVPYKGSAEVAHALMSGDLRLAILDGVTLFPLAAAGKVKLIGVSGESRSPFTPDVPTLDEQGIPNFKFNSWAAFFVPKGTPDEIVQQLHDASVKVMHMPDVKKRVESIGYIPGGKSVADFQAQYRTEYKAQGELIKMALGKTK